MIKKALQISLVLILYFIFNSITAHAKEYCHFYVDSTLYQEVEIPLYYYEIQRKPSTNNGMPIINYEKNELYIDSLSKCESINTKISYPLIALSPATVSSFSSTQLSGTNESLFNNAIFKTDGTIIKGLATKEDEEPPIITGYQNQYISNIDNPLDLDYLISFFSAYDNFDGNISDNIKIEYNEYTPNLNKVGNHIVIISVEDSSANKTSVTFYIEIKDTTKPTITGKNTYISRLSSPINVEQIKNNLTANDNYSPSLTSQIFTCADNYTINDKIPGNYSIYFCVYDSSSNLSNEFKVSVEVQDDIPPLIEGLNSYESHMSNPLSINEIMHSLVAYDNVDGDLTSGLFIIEDNYSNFQNKKGVKSIYFQAMDSNNNISVPFKVSITLIDDVSPQIFGLNIYESHLSNPLSLTYIKQQLTVLDNIDGNISNKLEIINDTYSNNINKKGTFYITFIANDSSSNASQEFKISITNIDDVKPYFSGPSNLVYHLSNKPSLNSILTQYTPKDNIDTNLKTTIVEDSYSSSNTTGIFFISISCSDESNNESVPFLITIEITDTVVEAETTIYLTISTSKQLSIEEISKLVNINAPYTIIKDTYKDNYNIETTSLIVYELEGKKNINLNITTFQEETTRLTNNEIKKETLLIKIKRFFTKIFSSIKNFFRRIFSLLITHQFY